MEESMVCKSCGSRIAPGAAFCTICGAKVETPLSPVTEAVENTAEEIKTNAEEATETMDNTTQTVDNNLVSPVAPTVVTPVSPVNPQPEPVPAQPVGFAPETPVETQPVQTQPVNPVPVPVQPVGTPVGQPVNAQPVAPQPLYTQPVVAQPVSPAPVAPENAPAETKAPVKKAGPAAYIFGSIVSLIEIVIMFVLVLITALRLGATVDAIESATGREDLGLGFLDTFAKVLPSLSNYIFIGIIGALCLAFAVLIFVIFSKRVALGFRTVAIDMLIVSGIYAFGMLFLNTYSGLLGSFNIDAELMTLLRTTCSEWVLILAAGLIVPAVIFLIVAAILDSVRYKKALKASVNR
ncbi:MAG: hypothetical protein J6113_03855 [Lachnospiraceae bacterium]|nr:hypothetical protein [Lachnospiraceae bacterium]